MAFVKAVKMLTIQSSSPLGVDAAEEEICMVQQDPVIHWLLQGDPAIRWQTQRDLLSADEAVVQAERQQVSTTGWGAKLLAYQEP